MGTIIQQAKSALRELVGERLRSMTAEERATASAQARELLTAQAQWQQAQSVLFFAPMPGELDVWPLLSVALAAGKRVALPRFERDTKSYSACRIQDPAEDVQMGYFGIREPSAHCAALPPSGMDLILVPGVAFDERGHRLGRGKAFYDRLLTVMNGPRCGVAFEQQVVPEIPVEPHDARMDCVLLPTRWIELAPRAG
jgi:5-formyltetrahydrofolate cyclo-ligase